MAEYNEAQVWSAINGEIHPTLSGDERTIAGYIPLVEELFPGINYYSTTGFGQVMRDYVKPVLTKLFPDLVGRQAEEVGGVRAVEVKTFLPSNGYEHLDNPDWKKRLEGLLV